MPTHHTVAGEVSGRVQCFLAATTSQARCAARDRDHRQTDSFQILAIGRREDGSSKGGISLWSSKGLSADPAAAGCQHNTW